MHFLIIWCHQSLSPFMVILKIAYCSWMNSRYGCRLYPLLVFLIIYNGAVVFKCQNFLKVVVQLIIFDQYNQSTLKTKSALFLPLSSTRRLIRVCTVCWNYKKLWVKWNSRKSPFRNIFQAYIQRESTYQCSQCFDFFLSAVTSLQQLLTLLSVSFRMCFVCLFSRSFDIFYFYNTVKPQ